MSRAPGSSGSVSVFVLCTTLSTPSGGSIFSTVPTSLCVVLMKRVAVFRDSSSSRRPNLTASTSSTSASPVPLPSLYTAGSGTRVKSSCSDTLSPAGFSLGMLNSPWISTRARPRAVATTAVCGGRSAPAERTADSKDTFTAGILHYLSGKTEVLSRPSCTSLSRPYSIFIFSLFFGPPRLAWPVLPRHTRRCHTSAPPLSPFLLLVPRTSFRIPPSTAEHSPVQPCVATSSCRGCRRVVERFFSSAAPRTQQAGARAVRSSTSGYFVLL